jgi:hypothetical protein
MDCSPLDLFPINDYPTLDYFEKDQDQFWPWRFEEMNSVMTQVIKAHVTGSDVIPPAVKEVNEWGIHAVIQKKRYLYAVQKHHERLNKSHTVLLCTENGYQLTKLCPYQLTARMLRLIGSQYAIDVPGIAERYVQDMLLYNDKDDVFTFEEIHNKGCLSTSLVTGVENMMNGFAQVHMTTFSGMTDRSAVLSTFLYDKGLQYKNMERWMIEYSQCIVGQGQERGVWDCSASAFKESTGILMYFSNDEVPHLIGLGEWIELPYSSDEEDDEMNDVMTFGNMGTDEEEESDYVPLDEMY